MDAVNSTVNTPDGYESFNYAKQRSGSYLSAAVIAPIVVANFSPGSVVDFGCGVGTWLRAFQERGVPDIQGMDGPHALSSKLEIPRDKFEATDLTAPIELGRKFDLAISLEVAEHLPNSAADTFVRSLVAASDIIVFSAAIPKQGGFMHVNEQWPSFWQRKFSDHGFTAFDLIRPLIWTDERVRWWYRQNILVYASAAAIGRTDSLKRASPATCVDLVHPMHYQRKLEVPPPRTAAKILGRSVLTWATGSRAAR